MGNTLTNDPYKELGVSSKKTGVHKATKNLSKGLYPGAFLPNSSYVSESA